MSNKSLFGTHYQQRPDSGGPRSLREVLTKTASGIVDLMDRRLKEIDGLNRAATDNAALAAAARDAAEAAARLATAARTAAQDVGVQVALAQTAAEAARETATEQAAEAQIAANEAEQASE